MYNYDFSAYYNDFLNSIYPNVGLHNISIIFEFNTPQKYDVTIKNNFYTNYDGLYNGLLFQFIENKNSNAKKIYSYNGNLNIFKKNKTVHITNISSSASYTNPLFYDVIVDTPQNSLLIFISNKTGVVKYDYSNFGMKCTYFFDRFKHEIKSGVYNVTIVNEYDNTFDSALFTLCNDIIINTTYKIKDDDVIFNIDLWCEYDTPLEFNSYKIINDTVYNHRYITKEILGTNNHKFNFEIIFNNVDNNMYSLDVWDYFTSIDRFHFTVNKTYVNEDENIENISGDVNESVNISNSSISKIYMINNKNSNGTNDNLDLKQNNTTFNSNQSHKSNFRHDNLRKIVSEICDSVGSDDSVFEDDVNSYEIHEKSSSKSSSNLFSSLRIIFLLFIALVVGFLKFKMNNGGVFYKNV